MYRPDHCLPSFTILLFVLIFPMVTFAQTPTAGDVNGDGNVDGRDILSVQRYLAGLVTLNADELVRADVAPIPGTDGREFGDGLVDEKDVQQLLRYVVGTAILPKPLPAEARQAAEALLAAISIPTTSTVSMVGPVDPGTTMVEARPARADGSAPLTLQTPATKGIYYLFFVDDEPWARFAHSVRYAWVDLETGSHQELQSDWFPKMNLPAQSSPAAPSAPAVMDPFPAETALYQADSQIQGVTFTLLSRWLVGTANDISHKPVAGADHIFDLTAPIRFALVVDLGDADTWGDYADNFASDADGMERWLRDNHFEVERISQYWGNSLPRIAAKGTETLDRAFEDIIRGYAAEFEKAKQEVGHEFFLYISSHGGEGSGNLDVHEADGSENSSQLTPSGLISALKDFPDNVHVTLFVDACYSGYFVEEVKQKKGAVSGSCGITILTAADSQHTAAAGPSYKYEDSATQDFLEAPGRTGVQDYDGDGGIDLFDRFWNVVLEGAAHKPQFYHSELGHPDRSTLVEEGNADLNGDPKKHQVVWGVLDGARQGPCWVEIYSPTPGQRFEPGQDVVLDGLAATCDATALEATLVWSSDRDGNLGTGSPLTPSQLTPGKHIITLRAEDAQGGLLDQASVEIVVERPLPSEGVVFFGVRIADGNTPANNALYLYDPVTDNASWLGNYPGIRPKASWEEAVQQGNAAPNGLTVSRGLKWAIFAYNDTQFSNTRVDRLDVAGMGAGSGGYWFPLGVMGFSFAPQYGRFLFRYWLDDPSYPIKAGVSTLPLDFKDTTSPTWLAAESSLRMNDPALSPDGRYLAGNSAQDGIVAIYDLQGKSEKILEIPARRYYDVQPLPSFDKWVAIASRQRDGREVLDIDLFSLSGFDHTLFQSPAPNVLSFPGLVPIDLCVDGRTLDGRLLFAPGQQTLTGIDPNTYTGFFSLDPDTGALLQHATDFRVFAIAAPVYP